MSAGSAPMPGSSVSVVRAADLSVRAPSSTALADVIAKVQANDPLGFELLHKLFARGLRYLLARQPRCDDLERAIHDIELKVIQMIREGGTPDRLPGLVCMVMRQKIADDYSSIHVERVRETGFQQPLSREFVSRAEGAIASMASSGREFLERFYLRGQSADEIRSEMKLTEQQFQLCKSNARSYFGRLRKNND